MTDSAPTPALPGRSVPRRPSVRIAVLLAAVAIAAIPAAALLAQDRGAAYTVVETGQGYARLQAAVDAIGEGKGTIAVSSGHHTDCAVQQAGDIAYLAQVPGEAIFDGGTCEGKAALVLRGRAAEVSGLVFQNMNVPDFNGAGIRLEHGNLTVAQSWFRDSQQGILTAGIPDATLIIDRSTFTRLGTCEGSGGCAHSVYTGELAQMRLTRSRFEQGRGGHYVKSRAIRVDIASNSFDDSAGRETNYMIDLPAGSIGQISNNWFVQGQSKENYSAFIAVAAEDIWHPSTGLIITGNDARFATGVDRRSTFVADWSGDNLAIGENRLAPNLQRFERR